MCMRRFLGLCLIVLGTANVAFAQKPGWKLVWEDNLDGTSLDYSKWECEIDIMELRGQTPNETLGTLHFGKSWPDNELTKEPPYRLKSGSFADDFHTFALEWEKGVMRWYVDEQLF